MSESTTAAVLVETGRPLRLLQLQIPPLRPGQVLVDVAWSGVCRAQLLEVRGAKGPDRYLPHALGHEGSGTVRAVGAGVTKVRPGEPVVLSWIRGSGAETGGTVYGSEIGPVNGGAVTTFLRATIASENRVTPIPPEMPLREAALLGCAIPTGAGMVLHTARVAPGSSVAVFGAGGVGLSAVLGAVVAGAGTIFAVDVRDAKLDAARRAGATHAIRFEGAVEEILAATGGDGVDAAIEATGRIEAMEAAFRSVRKGGGICVLAGNVDRGEMMKIDPYDLIAGKRLVGSWGGECDPDRDIPRFVELYRSGRLPLESLLSRTYPLEEVNAALDDLEAGTVLRALIRMSD